MTKACLASFLLIAFSCPGAPAPGNLLRNGDFASLEGWQANDHLSRAGKVARQPGVRGVSIVNPAIDIDGSLYQDTPTGGHRHFAYTARIKGGGMMRAALGFVALDASGHVLAIETPTRVSSMRWSDFAGPVKLPDGTTTLRTLLTVLDGECTFADVTLRRSDAPQPPRPRTRLAPGRGFAVTAVPVERPYWEIFSDDLDGDGTPELVGCDVDGIVTVRTEGKAPRLRFDADALVYQFAAADLDGDGSMEILLTSLDPKIPMRAVNLSGKIVREFEACRGPERIATGDLDGDGRPEIAASIDNGRPGSGIAGGVAVYDADGRRRWTKAENLRSFTIGSWGPGGDMTLIVGGPAAAFRIYNRAGELLRTLDVHDGLLEQFQLAEIAGGRAGVVLSCSVGRQRTLLAHDGTRTLWETAPLVSLGGSDGTGAWHVTADFDEAMPGMETAVVGTHGVALLDAGGAIIHQSLESQPRQYWEPWQPGGINSLDIAFWAGPQPHLFLSSSRFRHAAYYRLNYGASEEFSSFTVPDEERHLEALHAAVKARPPFPARHGEKVKVFMAAGNFARVPESTLREYRAALTSLETPALEYLVMYEASDLLGHDRGQKMTTEQIVERARLFEKVGIPFGYFAAHGGQVWISREAIRRSQEVAPRMFRFLYIAENLEILYSPLYKDVLQWTNEALAFCARHGMKMIFKEKHDVWGLLPADPEVFNILFRPEHRGVTVPVWSTNQPYQPEIQLGGMLGLRAGGLCAEFGMSTQYWNWHEWGRYPRGVRDVSPTYVCPSDVILRLDLMGLALGATWIHIEGGQTYLQADPRDGVVPLASRHRELAYELVRKNILAAGVQPANLNKTVVVRALHPALEAGKESRRKVAYPYYDRNTEELRRGLIPARYIFETYPDHALPRIAYGEDWNVRSCFPRTPFGWLRIVPPQVGEAIRGSSVVTDGERVELDGKWQTAAVAAPVVARAIEAGARDIELEAPGTCMILQAIPGRPLTAVIIDPGYLAPTGVKTTLRATRGQILRATDAVTGTPLALARGFCPLAVPRGAFRIVQVELGK